MPSEKIKSLKDRYENGPHKIGRDLVKTCLEECITYRRGTAYFGSSALRSYAGALGHILKENIKIEILCSPVISDKRLVEILKNNSTPEKRKKTVQELADKIVLSAIGLDTIQIKKDSGTDIKRQLHEYRSKLLAYLIAKGQLEIRFAILSDVDWPVDEEQYEDEMLERSDNDRNLYHVKKGYFVFADGSKIAFNGSFNETDTAHNRNIESAEVFKSWQEHDLVRLNNLVKSIDDDWESLNPYIEIYKLSDEAIKQIKQSAPTEAPKNPLPKNEDNSNLNMVNPVIENNIPALRDYQIQALKKWGENNFRGILAMATGSGKTLTAIHALLDFREKFPGGFIFVIVPKQNLATQWIENIRAAGIFSIPAFQSQSDWYQRFQAEAKASRIKKTKAPCIVSVVNTFKSNEFQEILTSLKNSKENRHLIIADECHYFNSEKQIKYLPDFIDYRLGLSATPYDQFEGEPEKQFLEKYFGEIIFKYTLRDAIEAGFLCKYDYHVIEVALDEYETDKYEELTKKIGQAMARDQNSSERSMSLDALLSQRARVLAVVGDKTTKLESLIKNKKEHFSLAYCGDGSIEENDGLVRQIDHVIKIFSSNGWNVGRITCDETLEEREYTIENLKRKIIDVIVSIKVLDEGIDIPSCQTAYILASRRSEREHIQRRGRVLRLSENKNKAVLYDFVITGAAKKSPAINRLVKSELERVWRFAEDSINKEETFDKFSSLAKEVKLFEEDHDR